MTIIKHPNGQLLFFIFVSCFLIVLGAMALLIQKGDAIIFFNDFRSDRMLMIIGLVTRLGEAGVFVAVVFLLSIKNYAASISLGLMGVFNLMLTYLLKWTFRHPRPFSYFSSLSRFGEVQGANSDSLYRGLTSFPSGHTMTAFALATFLSLLFPRMRFLFFLLAFAVGASRIILVQHFLEDAVFGALCGIIMGFVGGWMYNYLKMRFPNLNNSFTLSKRIK